MFYVFTPQRDRDLLVSNQDMTKLMEFAYSQTVGNCGGIICSPAVQLCSPWITNVLLLRDALVR